MNTEKRKITDQAIIKELQKNSRTPFSKIAEKFSVTEATIRKRVGKLVENGVIRRFTIEIDPKKIGYKIDAFIGFDIDEQHYTSALLEVRKFPEVISLVTSTGDHMVMIEAWFHSLEELNKFEEKLKTIQGVTDICPAIVVEKLK